jgi:hypothetical protein
MIIIDLQKPTALIISFNILNNLRKYHQELWILPEIFYNAKNHLCQNARNHLLLSQRTLNNVALGKKLKIRFSFNVILPKFKKFLMKIGLKIFSPQHQRNILIIDLLQMNLPLQMNTQKYMWRRKAIRLE